MSWLFRQLKADDDPALETATDPGVSPAGASVSDEASGSRKRREPPADAPPARVRLFLSSLISAIDSIIISIPASYRCMSSLLFRTLYGPYKRCLFEGH